MSDVIRILVVDDEQIVLDSVRKHLRKEECDVETVLCVDDALKVIDEADITFDIVLTDLMMPDTDGLEFMKMLKDRFPSMPVIMITGYATINTALQATQLGAFDYIAKPFSKKELLAVVRRAVDVVRGADAGSGGDRQGNIEEKSTEPGTFRVVGDHCWMMFEADDIVILGVEHAFINTVGKIQNVYLPQEGDQIRQGAAFLQIFSSDMRSHSVQSPLSGLVVAVNQKVLDDPTAALQDTYGEGWLIRLRPSRFDVEREILGV